VRPGFESSLAEAAAKWHVLIHRLTLLSFAGARLRLAFLPLRGEGDEGGFRNPAAIGVEHSALAPMTS
jgi:hypothetical protein